MARKSNRPKRRPYEYFSVAADILVLRPGLRPGAWECLLIERKFPPYQGAWALPGGFVDRDEDVPRAARRELREETNLRATRFREFGSFGRPGRDPRGRTLSIGYVTRVAKNARAKAGDDAKNLAWFPITRLPKLAFDHDEMIRRGLKVFRDASR